MNIFHYLGLRLGRSGTKFTELRKYTASVTVSKIDTDSSNDQTVTVTGIESSDTLIACQPSGGTITANSFTDGVCIAGAWASADDTVTMRFVNVTTSSANPSESHTWDFIALRPV